MEDEYDFLDELADGDDGLGGLGGLSGLGGSGDTSGLGDPGGLSGLGGSGGLGDLGGPNGSAGPSEPANNDPTVETAEAQQYTINVLDAETRKRIMGEVIQPEDDFFGEAISTTDTLDGFIRGCSLNEYSDTTRFEPCTTFLVICSNSCRKVYPWYTPPSKKNKKKSAIKNKNGTERELNSQISCWIRVNFKTTTYAYGDPIPTDEPVYKFKIFRTGRVQLPGANRNNYEKVVECMYRVAELLYTSLGLPEMPEPEMLNIVMRDYKTGIKIKGEELIDILKTGQALKNEIPNEELNPLGISIADMKCSGSDNLALVKFRTPLPDKKERCVAIKIFKSGRITILGALDSKKLMDVLSYIRRVIEKRRTELIVINGDIIRDRPADYEDNVPDDLDLPSVEDIINHRAYQFG